MKYFYDLKYLDLNRIIYECSIFQLIDVFYVFRNVRCERFYDIINKNLPQFLGCENTHSSASYMMNNK